MWVVAHILSLVHGLAAAFISIATFYLAGLLLLPRLWPSLPRWPDSVVLGLTFYVLLCWVATSSRAIPLSYVMLVFGGILWGLASLRFRWLQTAFGAPLLGVDARRWLVEFSLLYAFAYALGRTPAGPAVLTLPHDGGLDLVTYARYAKNLLTLGTASVDLATFDYLRSPASAFVLAWHSLPFLGDPLDAAMPAFLMLAALFGMTAADVSRSVFGLSRRSSMAIAGVALCAPMFRWTLGTYSLGELLAAIEANYDFILFDCPPNILRASQCGIFCSNEIYVPANPDALSLVGFTLLVEKLQKFHQLSASFRRAAMGQPAQVHGIIFNSIKTGVDIEVPKMRMQLRLNQFKTVKRAAGHAKIFNSQVRDAMVVRRAVALGLPVALVSAEATDAGPAGDNVITDYRRLATELVQHVIT
jgi:cellulose biosynthesis protein BcsQ